MTLTEFLLARLAEDERFAHQESQHADGLPKWGVQRLRADAQAKRRIVGRHDQWDGDGQCHECTGARNRRLPYPCPTLCDLASVYADHPDYRDEWRIGQ